jgi:PAS domain S-box-containing protein
MQGALGSLDSLKGVPLELALDRTGVGLVACDAAGWLTLLSPALQQLFGVTVEPATEPMHADLFCFYRADGRTVLPPEAVPLTRARRGEFVRDARCSTRRADGSLVHLKCNAVPLRNDEGTNCGAITIVQDVTAETEAAVRDEALRQRLVTTINHEFRTPLAALLGHVELINDHADELGPELAGWLAAIERSAWRLRDLVCEAAELVTDQDDPDDRP